MFLIYTIFNCIFILVFSSTDATTGEILMSGRHVMMGYMGNQEKTAETVVDSKEGWLRYAKIFRFAFNYNIKFF